MHFEGELKPTTDVLKGPSVLPPISQQKRDADLIASHGGKTVTYGVWRSGPVPPSWRPPGTEQNKRDL